MSDPGTYLPTYLPTQVGTYQRVNVIFTFFSFFFFFLFRANFSVVNLYPKADLKLNGHAAAMNEKKMF